MEKLAWRSQTDHETLWAITLRSKYGQISRN